MWSRWAGKSGRLARAALYGGGGGGALAVASVFAAGRDEQPKAAPVIAGATGDDDNWSITGPIKRVHEDLVIARRTTTKFDRTSLNLRLYQYEACPFCCKVRAFLDYYGFSYDVVEVRPLTRKEIKKLDGVRKLPTVVTGTDRKLSDSSLIISILTSYLWLKHQSLDDVIAMYPEKRYFVHSTGNEMVAHPNLYEVIRHDPNKQSTKQQQQQQLDRTEEKWRKWVDEEFIGLIVPNIYRSWAECRQMFRWFSEAGQWEMLIPTWERLASVYLGSTAMYFMSKKIRKKYDGDVRMLIIKACDKWMVALQDAPFLGGNSPNLADLAMYGALNSFKGSNTFLEIFANTEIESWYKRMRELVDAKAGAGLIAQRSIAMQ